MNEFSKTLDKKIRKQSPLDMTRLFLDDMAESVEYGGGDKPISRTGSRLDDMAEIMTSNEKNKEEMPKAKPSSDVNRTGSNISEIKEDVLSGTSTSVATRATLSALPKKDMPFHIVQQLLENYCIYADANAHMLYNYDEDMGYFVQQSNTIFSVWLHKVFQGSKYESKLTTSIVREVFMQLLAAPNIQAVIDDFNPDQPFVNLVNGVFDVANCQMVKRSPKYRFLNRVNGKYLDKDTRPELFYKLIKKQIPEEDERQLFLEEFAYLLSNFHSAKTCLYIKGKAHSGKTALLDLLTRLVGSHVVSCLPLTDFGRRFAIITLRGMHLNLCGEHNDSKVLRNTSVLKAVIGRDWLDAEPKGKAHTKFKAKTKCVFAANRMPPIDPRSMENALSDRFVFIEFHKTIPEEKRNPKFPELLWEERDDIVTFACNVLTDLYQKNMKFTEAENSERLKRLFKEQKTSVVEFVEERCQMGAKKQVKCQDLYNEYAAYCQDNFLEALSPICFVREILRSCDGVNRHRIHETGQNPVSGLMGIKLKNKQK